MSTIKEKIILKENLVAIDSVGGSRNEYIVRDSTGITIGRIFIIEFSKENKFCSFRIKFYRSGKEYEPYLKNALDLFLMSLFNEMDMYKVNVLAEEEINLNPFSDLGFELEGIITNSSISGNIFRDELLFGVDADTFQNNNKIRKLVLTGKNIELRVLTPEDADEMLHYYLKNKEYLKPYEPIREDNFYTTETQRRTLVESYKQFLNGTSVSMGIYKENRLVGKIRISNIVLGAFKSAMVGYSIDENEQGNGYMKEALKLIIDYAFDEMELHRIEASTLVDNVKSQRVLKSCGFKELGTNKNYLYINGQWRDHITYYKTNDK